MTSARPRTFITRGELPFETIDDPKGTGLFAEWSEEGGLVSVRFIVDGVTLKDGDVAREVRVVSPSRAEAPFGDRWSDGLAWSSGAAYSENYTPSAVPFAKWLQGQVADFGRLSKDEIERASRHRRLLGAASAVTACAFAWWIREFIVSYPLVFPLVAIGCSGALFLPLGAPWFVRGQRVPEEPWSSGE